MNGIMNECSVHVVVPLHVLYITAYTVHEMFDCLDQEHSGCEDELPVPH